VLYGLPAIVGAVAHLLGVPKVLKAKSSEVRSHFIGHNPKRVIAKAETVQQCARLGWQVECDNEADAVAVWSYMSALIEPETALRVSPLFRARPA